LIEKPKICWIVATVAGKRKAVVHCQADGRVELAFCDGGERLRLESLAEAQTKINRALVSSNTLVKNTPRNRRSTALNS
jgi:hypothetical protein